MCKLSGLLFCLISGLLEVSRCETVNFTAVSELKELKSFGRVNIDSICSMSTYYDPTNKNSNEQYAWITMPKTGSNYMIDMLSDIYSDEIIEFENKNNSIFNELPLKLSSKADPSSTSCMSPINHNIITCYIDENIENQFFIVCNILFNDNSSISNQIIVNNANTPGIAQTSMPQVLCMNDGFLVFYGLYFNDQTIKNRLFYSLLDHTYGNIVIFNHWLNNIIQPTTIQLGELNVMLSVGVFVFVVCYFTFRKFAIQI